LGKPQGSMGGGSFQFDTYCLTLKLNKIWYFNSA